MSISPRSGLGGSKDCYVSNIILYQLKWESRFPFGGNTAKITDCIKELFKEKWLSTKVRT